MECDGIVFLSEGYKFHLPLIGPNEDKNVYNRFTYRPFKAEIDGKVLKEGPKGEFVLDKPLEGLKRVDLTFEDGTKKDAYILFIRSYEFAVSPSSSEFFESPLSKSEYSYYRIPILGMSKKYENAQNAWQILLADATGEKLSLINSILEDKTTDTLASLDYEFSGDDTVLSFVFSDRYISQGVLDNKKIFVRNMLWKGLEPINNEEFLKAYDLKVEDIKKASEKFIEDNPEIEVDGEKLKLKLPNFEDLESLVIFVKDQGFYLSLAYEDSVGNGGYIPVRIRDVEEWGCDA